jgi:hypothetical protein
MRIERPALPKTISVDSKAEAKKSRGAEFRLQRDAAATPPVTTSVSARSILAHQTAGAGTACEGPYSKLAAGKDPVVRKLQLERGNMISASLRDLGIR